MSRIVLMTADRFKAMNQIDIEAWSDWATKKFGHAIEFPTKLPVYGTYLDGDPGGSFIALDDRDQPVGYIFTRTFGRVGFFGPFGVVPRHQGSHVGKALVMKTVEYMEQSGCTTIGLETMPETAYNLGLYSKLGFRMFTMTLRVHKVLPAGSSQLPANVAVMTTPTADLLERVRAISGTLEDGLDFSKEVALLREHPIGACLTYSVGGSVCGFALCYAFPDTVGLYPPSDPQNVRIRILAMDANRCGQDDLRAFMRACENYTRSLGRTTVTAPIYAQYHDSLQTLFAEGYRVHDGYPSLVKLARGHYSVPRPEAVCLSEWAG
ncbi:MAG: GNAT family N-acetyltransferase [Candidatus Binatia bacterium]